MRFALGLALMTALLLSAGRAMWRYARRKQAGRLRAQGLRDDMIDIPLAKDRDR